MAFKTDIEIAQETVMEPITEIAKIAGVDEKYLEQYGKYKAKVDYNILKDMADKPDGKLVLEDPEYCASVAFTVGSWIEMLTKYSAG